MPHRIAITGNIGSGKTTVCREFERLGIPVYYADDEAKRLMQQAPDLMAGIRAAFGAQSYLADGSLNRTYLAERVFGNPAALEQLNALVHPAVALHAADWHERQGRTPSPSFASGPPYTLHEAAIVLEIGSGDQYDAVVVVACPYAVREQRVTERDGTTPAAFAQRADRQWTDARKEAAADYLICNDGRHLILPQILALDRKLRRLRTNPKSKGLRQTDNT